MQKVFDFVKKHDELFTIIFLAVVCYFVFIFNIGSYALMDVDETRYVSMARDMFNTKDFLTLYLNGEYFFEKPPLYFWGECLSFALFGKINEFSARFPGALYALLSVFLIYFAGKKTVSKSFGIISALVFATTLEFVMLAKFAILDIVVTTCIGFSVIFGFLTQFVQERNKKYFWWLFYVFSALAVMAKGIPGFVVPFAVMFFVTLFNKTFKEVFKPQYILVGFLLFLLIVLPWHIKMFEIHNPLFFNEYIMKHHINRFFSSDQIHRAQPFWFYFVTVLWGLVPWVFSGLAVLFAKMHDLRSVISSGSEAIRNMTNEQKYFWFNVIAFIVTMLFFSVSKTKLITYILPVYFFTSAILGFVWDKYIKGEFTKSINLSVYISSTIFLVCAIAAMFAKFYLPKQFYEDIYTAQAFCVLTIGIFAISSIVFALKNKKVCLFASYVIFILVISAFGTRLFYNIDYKFGQNDLMEYAKWAKDNKQQVIVLNNGRKYSVYYYYGAKVYYISLDNEQDRINEGHRLFDRETVVIVRNKDLPELEKMYKIYTVKDGRKFSMVRFR